MLSTIYLIPLLIMISYASLDKDTTSETEPASIIPYNPKDNKYFKSANDRLVQWDIGHPDEDNTPHPTESEETEETTEEPEQFATDPIEDGFPTVPDYTDQAPAIQMPAAAVIRCSRRFTPGICQEPVKSVWTYAFDKQSCIERLGCSKSERTNRFKTLNRCTRRCHPLTTIYTDVLSMEEGKHRLPSSLRRWENYLEELAVKTPLPNDYYNEKDNHHNMKPVARQEPDYAIERSVLRSQEYTLDEENKVLSPDVDHFVAEQGLVENFNDLFT